MISRVIRLLATSLLITALPAQGSGPVKITFDLPNGLSDAFLAYEYHGSDGGGRVFAGGSLHSEHPFVEIPSTSDEFKAQVWIPGCKMQRFSVPIEKSDITLQPVCDSLNTVHFYGRIKGVDVGSSAQIYVSYMSMGLCFWLSRCGHKHECVGSCPGAQFGKIASGRISPDGTFEVDLPDFASDPIDAGGGELEFKISGLKDHFFLKPEGIQGVEIPVSPSYPSEVTFRAVSLNNLSSLTE
jgi:hypothetical protein